MVITDPIKFIDFHPAHLLDLKLQDAQDALQAIIKEPSYGAALSLHGMAYSGMLGGRVVGCAGVLPQTNTRAIAWALLENIPAPYWPAIHRKVIRVIRQAEQRGFRRIETQVAEGFQPGMRWVELLGFRNETPNGMAAWDPLGNTAYLFARVGGNHDRG